MMMPSSHPCRSSQWRSSSSPMLRLAVAVPPLAQARVIQPILEEAKDLLLCQAFTFTDL